MYICLRENSKRSFEREVSKEDGITKGRQKYKGAKDGVNQLKLAHKAKKGGGKN